MSAATMALRNLVWWCRDNLTEEQRRDAPIEEAEEALEEEAAHE